MIIKEINTIEVNKQKAEKLKEILKGLELPKKCFIDDDGHPDYIVTIREKWKIGSEEVATLSLNTNGSINIIVSIEEDVLKLKEYLIKSELKFKLIFGGGEVI